MLIWQTEIGIESQRRFCKFFVGLSHSRFNRRARMLLPLMRRICQAWNQEVKTAGEFLIIDSFPVPVCQPIRNYRVKIFRGIADIGYKATKKICYYGSCYSKLALYTVTQVLVHNAKNNEINARLSLKQLGLFKLRIDLAARIKHVEHVN